MGGKNLAHHVNDSCLQISHWHSTASESLGWAYFPPVLLDKKESYYDGIIMDWRTMPGGPCSPDRVIPSGLDIQADCEFGEDAQDSCCKFPYDEGKVLVHEVG